MQSFLLISPNQEEVLEYSRTLLKKWSVSKFDIEIFESEKKLGIETAREIKKKIYLKPFQGSYKAVIINALTGITVEAQNSLLKILEEPPEDTIMILLAPKKEVMLPTVISRCNVIEIKTPDETKRKKHEVEFLFSEELPIGERLWLAQKLSKTREESLEFLKTAIIAARERVLSAAKSQDSINSRNVKLILKLQSTYRDIENTNVSPRLSLENLLLKI